MPPRAGYRISRGRRACRGNRPRWRAALWPKGRIRLVPAGRDVLAAETTCLRRRRSAPRPGQRIEDHDPGPAWSTELSPAPEARGEGVVSRFRCFVGVLGFVSERGQLLLVLAGGEIARPFLVTGRAERRPVIAPRARCTTSSIVALRQGRATSPLGTPQARSCVSSSPRLARAGIARSMRLRRHRHRHLAVRPGVRHIAADHGDVGILREMGAWRFHRSYTALVSGLAKALFVRTCQCFDL